jgi:hypothetical protein
MPRFLLAVSALAAAVSLSPASASDQGCDTTRGCVTYVCGRDIEDGCRAVDRCHHWTDEPTCLYPVVTPICSYPYDGSICLPWKP